MGELQTVNWAGDKGRVLWSECMSVYVLVCIIGQMYTIHDDVCVMQMNSCTGSRCVLPPVCAAV